MYDNPLYSQGQGQADKDRDGNVRDREKEEEEDYWRSDKRRASRNDQEEATATYLPDVIEDEELEDTKEVQRQILNEREGDDDRQEYKSTIEDQFVWN